MAPAKLRNLQTNDLDNATYLAGVLSSDGVADLHDAGSDGVNGSADPNKPPIQRNGTDDSVERYEDQTVDATALREGSRGGGVEIQLDGALGHNGSSQLNTRTNIPIKLEKTDKRGRYLLTADGEIQEILRRGLERQQMSTSESKKRSRIKELVFTRRFTKFDRQNPSNVQSEFHGFFTLFWLAMFLLLVRVAGNNYKTYGSVLGNTALIRMMFRRDIIVLGITDGVMCLSTVVGLFVQLLVVKGWISWNRTGVIIQNIWQTLYIGTIVGWAFYREWPWTHTIFVVLHGLVFIMKQHSYAFYNGYLSQVYKRKQSLERRLYQLQTMSPLQSPAASPRAAWLATGTGAPSSPGQLRHRRTSSTTEITRKGSNLASEPSEITSIAETITSGKPLDSEQLHTFKDIITGELEALTAELKGKCSLTENYYPQNLTLWNWAEWTCFPTLVYELEYPRQESINWYYVAEKTVAVFGVLGIMQVISQAYIYPTVLETIAMKEAGMTLQQRWDEFPWILMDMLFPLLLEQLLTWYLIWECVLNVLAELTRFADRGFYGDWWNSVSWDQYARDWNRPVHNFLLRHVYHSSISAFHLSKATATFATFFLSACVHELLMFCLFKKVRGYLFALQLFQLPLVAMSRTKLLKGRSVLGNTVFWIGLFVGPSLITSLYLIV